MGEAYSEVTLVLTLLLPGTAITYYGQELGMHNVKLTYEQTVDPKGRNAGRVRVAYIIFPQLDKQSA